MLIGQVRDFGQHLVPYTVLHIEGTSGRSQTVVGITDTGYTGSVALPPDPVAELGFEPAPPPEDTTVPTNATTVIYSWLCKPRQPTNR